MFPEESFREHLQYDRFIFYIYTFFTKIMAIIEDIVKGVKQEDGEYIVIEDRRAAIRYAMDIGKKDDIMEHRQNF